MALIGFDVDGPLADFTGGLCARLQLEGYDYQIHDVQSWDLSKSIHTDTMPTVDRILSTAGFCASLEWMLGAKELVRDLRRQGHEVVAVTSPHPSRFWMHERRAWLRELFDDRDILFVHGKRKNLVAVDFLVEDHPGNLVHWCWSNPHGLGLLVNRPWNGVRSAEWTCHPMMVRVEDHEIPSWIGEGL